MMTPRGKNRACVSNAYDVCHYATKKWLTVLTASRLGADDFLMRELLKDESIF